MYNNYQQQSVVISWKNTAAVHTWYRSTPDEGVTAETSPAAADRVVIDDLTLSVDTACTGARVGTLELVARSVTWALVVDYTLRSTVGWSTDVLWSTWAHGLTVVVTAHAVRSARSRVARIRHWGFCHWKTVILSVKLHFTTLYLEILKSERLMSA